MYSIFSQSPFPLSVFLKLVSTLASPSPFLPPHYAQGCIFYSLFTHVMPLAVPNRGRIARGVVDSKKRSSGLREDQARQESSLPRRCIPHGLVWSWPGPSSRINGNDTRQHIKHQDGSHFEPHLSVDLHLMNPSFVSVLLAVIPCCIRLYLDIRHHLPRIHAPHHCNKAHMSRWCWPRNLPSLRPSLGYVAHHQP
ncbi:hypothetical protein N656DRAFT_155292 [Canariomyces notabilis]|uniref:Uncharacterized protein n=1 Tax=Canariomyces notabilis TaxID=2074819 RepID=A0AAN6TBK4_9PEZI|nr:hypothetical protein N656DRAFT_155292 [Canariomyces arenarius]